MTSNIFGRGFDSRRLHHNSATSASHFAAFFFAVQVIGGLLLLSGRFVPLALTLLAALYNILAFHLTMAPSTIAPALVAPVLWVLVFLQYRESFNSIFTEGGDAGLEYVAIIAAIRSG